MPRNGHGGRRQGAPGQAHANRSDLNHAANQAATALPGGSHGDRAESLRAQQALPLPDNRLMARPAGPFDRPTERPDEPVTAGLPFGDGPGPEALPNLQTGPSETERLFFERFLPAIEAAARRPGATGAARQLARRLRAVAPVDLFTT